MQMVILVRRLIPGIFAKSRIRKNGERMVFPSEEKSKNSSFFVLAVFERSCLPTQVTDGGCVKMALPDPLLAIAYEQACWVCPNYKVEYLTRNRGILLFNLCYQKQVRRGGLPSSGVELHYTNPAKKKHSGGIPAYN